jgi:hypothetical protein
MGSNLSKLVNRAEAPAPGGGTGRAPGAPALSGPPPAPSSDGWANEGVPELLPGSDEQQAALREARAWGVRAADPPPPGHFHELPPPARLEQQLASYGLQLAELDVTAALRREQARPQRGAQPPGACVRSYGFSASDRGSDTATSAAADQQRVAPAGPTAAQGGGAGSAAAAPLPGLGPPRLTPGATRQAPQRTRPPARPLPPPHALHLACTPGSTAQRSQHSPDGAGTRARARIQSPLSRPARPPPRPSSTPVPVHATDEVASGELLLPRPPVPPASPPAPSAWQLGDVRLTVSGSGQGVGAAGAHAAHPPTRPPVSPSMCLGLLLSIETLLR